MKALLLCLTSLCALQAQTAGAVSQLLDLARQGGAEFFGDTAFRILEAPRAVSQQTEKQILLEVFERAGDIRGETPYYPARAGNATERARVLIQAQPLRLDRLSLRTRVVDRLVALQDARQARKLFEEIDLPYVARPGCADPVVPVAPVYWETLSNLVLQDGAFTPLERERQFPQQMFEERLRTIRAAPDLAAAVTATLRVAGERDREGVFLAALGATLGAVNDADRAFSLAVERMGLVENVLALAQDARRRGLPMAGLVTSLRGFLVRHYQAERCADTVALPDSVPHYVQVASLYRPIDTFNRLAPPLVAQLEPIRDRDRIPARQDFSVPVSSPAERLRLADMQGRVAKLRELRNSPNDFRQAAAEVGTLLREWQEDNVLTGLEFFHQKTLALRGFLQMVAGGDPFRAAVADYLRLLAVSPARREAPAEWLFELNGLLSLTREPENRRDTPRHPSSAIIIESLVESYDPLLRLYGRMEQLYPVKR